MYNIIRNGKIVKTYTDKTLALRFLEQREEQCLFLGYDVDRVDESHINITNDNGNLTIFYIESVQ